MSEWIDFKSLREQLDFRKVLESYGVELKAKGRDQHVGFCPLPTHPSRGKRSPSFSANLARGIWRCFGCQASGNILDFAVRMEGRNPAVPADVRAVALTLRERFNIAPQTANARRGQARSAPKDERSHALFGEDTDEATAEQPTKSDVQHEIIVNAPLDFALKGLDPEHPYLRERGFHVETVEHFGLGYCNRGLLVGRVAIPLHDLDGRLIGYAGRITSDERIDEKHPKYLFPPKRERAGKVFELHKSLLVYNADRIERPTSDLFVVEGFASVWWFWQHGIPNTVALMGASCSDEQAAIIVKLTTLRSRVWVVPDGDEAGTKCAESVLMRVARERFVRWLPLPRGKQPTELAKDELPAALEEKK
ncbi:MAG: CHC2 zinc finger domain-containing protein [Tepidisphaeraceae bacterium]